MKEDLTAALVIFAFAVCLFLTGYKFAKSNSPLPEVKTIYRTYHAPVLQDNNMCWLYDEKRESYFAAGLIDGSCDEWARDYKNLSTPHQ